MLPPVVTTEVAGHLPVGWPRRQQLVLGLVLLVMFLAVASEWWRRRPKPVFVTETQAVVEPLAVENGTQLDINQASVSQLAALPGIGPTLAQRIIAYRDQHGPFSKLEELLSVPGIGPKTLQKLRQHVSVGEPVPPAAVSVTLAVSDYGPRAGLKTPVSTSVPGRPASASKQLPDSPLDINRASREELMQLPGIGPVLAERIVTHRQTTGPFRRVEDLTRIRGIKGRTLEKLRPYIRVGDDPSTVVSSSD